MAGFLTVEADELSRGLNLNKELEWALDMEIYRRWCVGLANLKLTFLPLGSIINLKNTFHLDQILMQWQWMLFQYPGLNNMSIFFAPFSTLSFAKDCGRRGESINSSLLWKTQSWWP